MKTLDPREFNPREFNQREAEQYESIDIMAAYRKNKSYLRGESAVSTTDIKEIIKRDRDKEEYQLRKYLIPIPVR